MHRQTLELMDQVLGREHPHTHQSRRNLAECLGAKNERREPGRVKDRSLIRVLGDIGSKYMAR